MREYFLTLPVNILLYVIPVQKRINKIKRSLKTKNNDPSVFLSKLQDTFDKTISWKYFGLLFSLLFFALMLFFSYKYHRIGDYGVETDFYQSYVPHARDFLNGILTIDSFKGPVYQVILGVAGLAFTDLFRAGIFISVGSAAMFLYLTFGLLKNLYSEKIAAVTLLFISFNPIFIQYTYSAGTDMFFAALIMASFVFLFKTDVQNYKNVITGAFIGGIAYLTRYNGIFILGFLLIILFVNINGINVRGRIKASLIFLGTFFTTILPWGIFCLIKKGDFFVNENYKNIAYEIYGRGKISWESFWYAPTNEFKSLSDVIFKDPVLIVKTILGNIYANFVDDMGRLLGWYLGVPLILGIIFYLLSENLIKSERRKFAYYLMNTFFFLILALVFYSERFSFLLLPFYLVIIFNEFFARSISVLGDYFSKSKFITRSKLKIIAVFFITSLFLISVYDTIEYNSELIDSGPKEILQLKDWYFSNVPESDRGLKIAARKPQVGYYLDMKFNVIPIAENLVELLDFLKKNNDDYLYFSWVEAGTRPELKYLLDSGPDVPGLERMVSFKEPPAVLYRVLKGGK